MTDDLRAETVQVSGHDGDQIEAYLAQPLGAGPFGAVVVIHHLPGYDEASLEITRRFAAHGYLAICPNLYSRDAPGASPAEAAAIVRAAGGVPDDRLVGDVDSAAHYVRSLPSSNAKVGVIGFCSGGRHAFLAACRLPLDAAVDCYGAFIVNPPPAESPLKTRAVVGLAGDLSCPLLGLFGVEDRNPSPAETATLAGVLTEHGKSFEFHTMADAGHAFFAVDRPNYRPEAANKGWPLIWDFFGRYLA
ncbi:MAG: carboxymethylenebutenolidase [Acidimicrobiaceae bacterium]|nr:carboxymethylenebutenolidase [Acidimicrobiaceae bacterium]